MFAENDLLILSGEHACDRHSKHVKLLPNRVWPPVLM